MYQEDANPSARKEEEVGEECGREDVPPGMAPKMLNLLKMVDKLEQDLSLLISRPYYDVLNKLLPLERAKIGMMEIYTINSLFWVLMRTAGEDVNSALRDDYKVEMGRLKETQARITREEDRAHRCRVDLEAASRFIRHGLGLNTRKKESEEEQQPVEEDESSLYLAKKRRKLQEQAIEDSSSNSESEAEEESDENNDMDMADSNKNRSWYGKGW